MYYLYNLNDILITILDGSYIMGILFEAHYQIGSHDVFEFIFYLYKKWFLLFLSSCQAG